MNLSKLTNNQILNAIQNANITKNVKMIRNALFTRTVTKNEITYYKYIVVVNSSTAINILIKEENNIIIASL